jgi:hypothetical protein
MLAARVLSRVGKEGEKAVSSMKKRGQGGEGEQREGGGGKRDKEGEKVVGSKAAVGEEREKEGEKEAELGGKQASYAKAVVGGGDEEKQGGGGEKGATASASAAVARGRRKEESEEEREREREREVKEVREMGEGEGEGEGEEKKTKTGLFTSVAPGPKRETVMMQLRVTGGAAAGGGKEMPTAQDVLRAIEPLARKRGIKVGRGEIVSLVLHGVTGTAQVSERLAPVFAQGMAVKGRWVSFMALDSGETEEPTSHRLLVDLRGVEIPREVARGGKAAEWLSREITESMRKEISEGLFHVFVRQDTLFGTITGAVVFINGLVTGPCRGWLQVAGKRMKVSWGSMRGGVWRVQEAPVVGTTGRTGIKKGTRVREEATIAPAAAVAPGASDSLSDGSAQTAVELTQERSGEQGAKDESTDAAAPHSEAERKETEGGNHDLDQDDSLKVASDRQEEEDTVETTAAAAAVAAARATAAAAAAERKETEGGNHDLDQDDSLKVASDRQEEEDTVETTAAAAAVATAAAATRAVSDDREKPDETLTEELVGKGLPPTRLPPTKPRARTPPLSVQVGSGSLRGKTTNKHDEAASLRPLSTRSTTAATAVSGGGARATYH